MHLPPVGDNLEQSGDYRIAADRETVWVALNNPDVLAQCIAGCQSMERLADDRFNSVVKAKIGPVSATFTAELVLSDIQAPQSYTITANVKGGPAGFGKGAAKVVLADEDANTLLSYQVDANVGGKLAQVGSRLIDGAARKMADDFFAAFGTHVGGAAPEKTGATASDEPKRYQASQQWKIWVAVFAVLIVAMILAL